MRKNLILLAILATLPILNGCLAPKLPTNVQYGNTGAHWIISNLTLSTPWGTEKIEYMEGKQVLNEGTNGGFIPLRPHQ